MLLSAYSPAVIHGIARLLAAIGIMQQLGRYEIVAEIGRGAMGAVFRARDPRIDRTVAIKTISVAGAGAKSIEEYRQRFFREAQAAGRLSHPGIVAIFDVGEDVREDSGGGTAGPMALGSTTGSTSGSTPGSLVGNKVTTPYIVMEYVDGRTLDELVEAALNQRLQLEMALDLVQQVAMALDYAQSAQIVHRDIKPANIIVTHDGRAKIADFGIAKISLAEVTLPGHVLGTPAYMSPEQLSGKPIDGRSDLFSLGVIAYWLLTGEKPFTGNSITEVSIQVATKDPAAPTSVDPTLGSDVDYILGRALAKDPDRRYQRGRQLSADIQDLRSGARPRSMGSEDLTMALPATAIQQTVAMGTAASFPQPVASSSAAPSVARTLGTTTSRQAASPSTATPTPLQPPHPRPRRGAVFYSLIGAAVTLVTVAAFAARFNRALPADLQIVGKYPFRSAEVFIWVDGDLRYHDELRGALHPHGKFHEAAEANGGNIALTLPVRAGTHTVRVRVDAPGEAYDRDTSIPGQFRAYSQKTLLLNFREKRLNLEWE
jgi:serine/threonine protein kinase